MGVLFYSVPSRLELTTGIKSFFSPSCTDRRDKRLAHLVSEQQSQLEKSRLENWDYFVFPTGTNVHFCSSDKLYATIGAAHLHYVANFSFSKFEKVVPESTSLKLDGLACLKLKPIE